MESVKRKYPSYAIMVGNEVDKTAMLQSQQQVQTEKNYSKEAKKPKILTVGMPMSLRTPEKINFEGQRNSIVRRAQTFFKGRP